MKAEYSTKTARIVLKKRWLREIDKLDDIDAGQLFKAILAFANGYRVDIENCGIADIFTKITEEMETTAKLYIEKKRNANA